MTKYFRIIHRMDIYDVRNSKFQLAYEDFMEIIYTITHIMKRRKRTEQQIMRTI